jgi:hypothetical protein
MLSRSSFKTELETFRADLYRPRTLDGAGNRNSADLELLGRWIDDGRTEEIWRALKRRKADSAPVPFIEAVLTARRSAVATIARTTSFKAQWELDFAKMKKRVSKLQRSAGPLAIAAALDDAAARLRNLHTLHFGIIDHAKFPLSRKDQGGSRRRRLFMQIMGDYFTREYGAPLDDHAATLAEIALADHELQRDHARNARRPTTARTRAKKAVRYIRSQKPI